MKICNECGQSVQDIDTTCPRCGSNQFSQIGDMRGSQPKPAQAPMTGPRPNQVRQPMQAPAGYRSVTGQAPQGQRPMTGAPMPGARPIQPQQARPVQGTPGQPQPQRPAPGRAPGQVPNQMGAMPRQPQPQPQQARQQFNQQTVQNQGFGQQNSFDATNEFGEPLMAEEPKKGLFGKKNKQPKQPKQPKQSKQPKQAKQPKIRKNTQDPMQMQQMQQTAAPIPQTNPVSEAEQCDVVSVKDWIFVFIQLMIPIYNIIYLLKSVSSRVINPSIKNYLKVVLVLSIISIVFSLLIVTLFSSAMGSMFL